MSTTTLVREESPNTPSSYPEFCDERTPLDLVIDLKLAEVAVRYAQDYGDEATAKAQDRWLLRALTNAIADKFSRENPFVN